MKLSTQDSKIFVTRFAVMMLPPVQPFLGLRRKKPSQLGITLMYNNVLYSKYFIFKSNAEYISISNVP